MKKLSLITEFKDFYIGSDLQKIVNNNPLPIKHTINDFDCYFYNADLFGLFEWKIQKDGITTNDFINDYQKGFEKGLLHLKELEKIKLKDLKSKDLREGTILQLKNILHEREFKLGSKGLLDLVFNKVPLIFTEKNIFDYGYWNGIIYSIDDIIEKAGLTLDELKTSEPKQSEKDKEANSQYSVLEWATIFYYADETKLLTDDKTVKARMEKFMNKHSITTTFDNFKNNYHTAKKRINKINDFPISKLNHIIPFVKENYKQAVTKIENDIIFLENENDDY